MRGYPLQQRKRHRKTTAFDRGIYGLRTGNLWAIRPDYGPTMPCLIAKWISSALPLIPSNSVIRYLWSSTVRAEMWSLVPISCAVNPSTSRWRISRWRNVNDATGSCASEGRSRICSISPARTGVMNVRPCAAARTASTSSSGAECLSTIHGTRFHGAIRISDVAMHREKDNAHIGIEFPDLFERFDAIQDRHRDVGHNDIGLQRFGGFNHGAAVLHRADQIEFGNEQAFQSFRKHPMIVREQDAYAPHEGVSRIGTQATIVVPRPGVLWILSHPPCDRILSRMLACPRLGRRVCRAGSNPLPLSLTARRSPPALKETDICTMLALA